MITVRHLTRGFGDRPVVSDLSFTVEPGSPVALMGPNASGKTTVLNLVLGLLEPDAGQIDGVAGRRLAAVFQDDRLCEQLSAVSNVRLVLSRRTPTERVVDELVSAGLAPEAARQPVAELSGGQRRRVCLVRALIVQAEVVCLDEPFAGIDSEGRAVVEKYVRQHCTGREVLLTTHDPRDVHLLGARVVRLRPPA